MTTIDKSQRWTEGKMTWMPSRSLCDVTKLEVAEIEYRDSKTFVTEHHYSRSFPSASLCVGLFRAGTLVGTLAYSVPASQAVLPKWTGLQFPLAMDLGRLVLLDEVDYNAESYLVAAADKLLKERKYTEETERGIITKCPKAVIAMSDPCPRRALDGTIILPGHWGTIYQARSAAYLGRSGKKTLYLAPDGTSVSPRAIQKVRKQEQGHAYAERQLVAAGCPEREEGEPPEVWIRRVLPSLRQYKHPGNHVYAWGIRKGVKFTDLFEKPKAIDPELVERAQRNMRRTP